MTLNEYMELPYRMEVVPDKEEGGYAVTFPELPGCITCGATLESALSNAEDAKKEWLLAALEEVFPPEATWTHPEGGLFIWVTLPEYVDTGSMLAEALDAGVTYVPGDSFYPAASGGKNSMRINFSYESPENLTEAVRRLAEVIERRLELYRVFIEAGAIDPARAPINTH